MNIDELADIWSYIEATKHTQKLFEENNRPEGVKACEDMLEAMHKRAEELIKAVVLGE